MDKIKKKIESILNIISHCGNKIWTNENICNVLNEESLIHKMLILKNVIYNANY